MHCNVEKKVGLEVDQMMLSGRGETANFHFYFTGFVFSSCSVYRCILFASYFSHLSSGALQHVHERPVEDVEDQEHAREHNPGPPINPNGYLLRSHCREILPCIVRLRLTLLLRQRAARLPVSVLIVVRRYDRDALKTLQEPNPTSTISK